MSKTMGPCHLSHPLDTHPGKQQQQQLNLLQCALLTLETKTFCFQRHLNCHENLQFIPGKTYPGFTGNDKGRDDVQSKAEMMCRARSGMSRKRTARCGGSQDNPISVMKSFRPGAV